MRPRHASTTAVLALASTPQVQAFQMESRIDLGFCRFQAASGGGSDISCFEYPVLGDGKII